MFVMAPDKGTEGPFLDSSDQHTYTSTHRDTPYSTVNNNNLEIYGKKKIYIYRNIRTHLVPLAFCAAMVSFCRLVALMFQYATMAVTLYVCVCF